MRFQLALGALALLAVASQGTVLRGVLFPGVTPDLAFALTLVAARRGGTAAGAVLGCWGGLLTGALVGGMSLPMGAIYAAAGAAAGLYFEATPWDRLFELACLVAALSLSIAAAQAALLAWLGLPYVQGGPTILPATLWNVAILTPLLSLIRPRR